MIPPGIPTVSHPTWNGKWFTRNLYRREEASSFLLNVGDLQDYTVSLQKSKHLEFHHCVKVWLALTRRLKPLETAAQCLSFRSHSTKDALC